MHELELTQIVYSGQNVSSDHFGGNVVGRRNTDNGVPDDENQIAHQELDISVARYPAGEPDIMYRDGMVIDGALPDHLVNFLTAARANGQTVVVVTPTHDGYHGSDSLIPFTRLVMNQFSDVVHAFEIGNEYWNHQTETSYGQVANDSAIAISIGLSPEHADVPIWVQMGDAGGQTSEYAVGTELSEGVGWLWRNIEANNLILDQLTQEARSVIDGVVEHYYFREDSQYLNGTYNDQNIVLDHGIWEAALGHDLTLNITEWNIRSTNLDQLGISAASTIIAQFSFMMEMEVDEAYVWPPMHNTSTDLAGGDYVILDPATGVVVNSVGGAAFDLMSSSLVGLQYLPSATANDSSLIEEYVYADNNRVVVYITSRSDDTENVSFSLGEVFPFAVLTSATQIGYDRTTSDGQHFDYVQGQFVDSEAVIVDGEEYYLNEHDVQATIMEHDVSQTSPGSDFTFSLLPFEVIELVYELPSYERTDGTAGTDIFSGEGETNDLVYSLGGSDNIQTGLGQDTVHAGQGNDYVDSGLGDDLVLGDAGNDILRGRGGNDTVLGGAGNDNIDAGWGDDQLSGGSGSDIVDGGYGRDTITADSGSDIVLGGGGDDLILLDTSQTYDAGWSGLNVSNQYQVGTGVYFSIENYNSYSSVIIGGEGYDILEYGNSNDAIFLHNDFADLHNDVDSFSDISLSSIFSGIEEIRAGAGDDLVDLTSVTSHLIGENLSIYGDSGDDIIWGSAANETICGGEGNDTLFGGAGTDSLLGGSGADTFEFTSTSAGTSILDFDIQSGDRIRIYQDGTFQLTDIELNANYFSLSFESGLQIDVNISTVEGEAFTVADYWSVLDLA